LIVAISSAVVGAGIAHANALGASEWDDPNRGDENLKADATAFQDQ